MQALELNLSTRPFRNNTLPWVGLVLATCGLVAATIWNVQTYRTNTMLYEDLVSQYGTIEEQLADLDRRDDKAALERRKRDLEYLALQAEKANEVIRWKAFSWTRLFNMLEDVLPHNVQMTAVHPVFRPEGSGERASLEDPQQVPISVEGVAKTLHDFSALQQSLIDDPHFDRVAPERVQLDPERNGETVFRVRFLYDPRVGQEPSAEAPVATAEIGPAPLPVTAGEEVAAEGWDRPGLEGEN